MNGDNGRINHVFTMNLFASSLKMSQKLQHYFHISYSYGLYFFTLKFTSNNL